MQTGAIKIPKARREPREVRLARDTICKISSVLNSTSATTESHLYIEPLRKSGQLIDSHWRLNPALCPALPKTEIRVINQDTLEAVTDLLARCPNENVCVLNMANQYTPGGGWLMGAMAQEEQLCYRSTLSQTLDPSYYPMPDVSVVYSPRVAIFRTAAPDYTPYDELPSPREPEIFSVISAAAVRCRGGDVGGGVQYKKKWQRELMDCKIRLILRVAARRKERRLVLGALGCGAFLNPPVEVAQLFRRVLQEEEFSGGWWKEIVFAVFVPGGRDMRASENLMVFQQKLEGLEV